jgi:hypothetical protein
MLYGRVEFLFLEAGKSYTFAIPIAGEVRVKVLEIDREAGWVRLHAHQARPWGSNEGGERTWTAKRKKNLLMRKP